MKNPKSDFQPAQYGRGVTVTNEQAAMDIFKLEPWREDSITAATSSAMDDEFDRIIAAVNYNFHTNRLGEWHTRTVALKFKYADLP